MTNLLNVDEPKSKREKKPRPANALLSIDECAGLIGLSRWTISAMIQDGSLPGLVVKSGKRKKIWRVRPDALQRWIAAKEAETKKLLQGSGGERALKAV